MAAIIEQIYLNEKKGVARVTTGNTCAPEPIFRTHGRHFSVEQVDF